MLMGVVHFTYISTGQVLEKKNNFKVINKFKVSMKTLDSNIIKVASFALIVLKVYDLNYSFKLSWEHIKICCDSGLAHWGRVTHLRISEVSLVKVMVFGLHGVRHLAQPIKICSQYDHLDQTSRKCNIIHDTSVHDVLKNEMVTVQFWIYHP